jgi:glycosyltransferase involved in cell wall biosynthesis
MLEGASIICFAHDWGGDPTSKTHIMRILAEKNRILWVSSIGMRRPTASGRDVRRLLTKARVALRGSRRVAPNLTVFNPLVLPFPGAPGVQTVNTAILSTSIRYHCRRLGLTRPIMWSFLPNVSPLVGRLGESLVIYHCVDEYSAFAGVARETLQRMERDLIRKAHVVFTSSEELARERRPHNARTFFVSHAVDVAHFSRALSPNTAPPPDIGGLKRPVIGFFGLIAEWIDLALVREIALARPEWSVVLIGKATTDLTPVRDVPNIHLLGQKPYETLPAYAKAFEVGLIPFRLNELTRKANPLKLREYLAAGVPVVSSDLPEVRRYESLVRVASGAGEFIHAIEAALREGGDAERSRRVAAMRAESWEARVDELSRHIVTTRRREPAAR